ncbi:hypothetical protein [Alistipes indistinctus]
MSRSVCQCSGTFANTVSRRQVSHR